VAAQSVIEHLNILKQAGPRLIPRMVILEADRLRFDRVEKALHHRIVGTMPLAAHAADQPVGREQPLIVKRGVLAALVGVHHGASIRAPHP